MNTPSGGFRVLDYAFSSMVALLTVLVTIVGAITKVVWHKIEKLEAERTAAAVTAERIGALAGNIERLTDEQATRHLENSTFARAEAEKTAHWREEIMTPLIRKLTDDSIRHELRLERLEDAARGRRDRDER